MLEPTFSWQVSRVQHIFDDMESLHNSIIEFTEALEELGNYLEQYDPPQWVYKRMEELNKEIDTLADKALKDYQRIRSRTKNVSLYWRVKQRDWYSGR